MFRRWCYIAGWWLLTALPAAGQELQPRGYFHRDSIRVGEPVGFSLWVDYPRDLNIVFPDSLYDFSPFELTGREWFPTRTDSLTSRDSTVYFITTFELDSIQYLRLPVFRVGEFDSTAWFTEADSVFLQRAIVTSLPDTLALVDNTAYQPVPRQFNYPYFLLGTAGAASLMLAVWLAFGRRLRTAWHIYRIKKRHRQFIRQFNRLLARDPLEVTTALAYWKNYLEWLLNQPVSKLTTREIVQLTGSERLARALGQIDRHIYAGDRQAPVRQAFEDLLLDAIDRYHHRLNDLRHAS